MKKILFALLFLLCGASAFCQDESGGDFSLEERITSFVSDIVIGEDGTIEVTENIRVFANQGYIVRGIYRDIPVNYRDNFGNTIKSEITVLSADKNNFKENFRVEKRKNYIRIYLGKSDVILEPGYYIYTIRYEAKRQIGFFDDHDELYWNVNGNYWSFPAETIECNVFLPRGSLKAGIKYDGFSGYYGFDAKDFTVATDSSRESVKFLSTRRYESGEGLTVLVGIGKGFIAEPTKRERAEYFISDNKDILFSYCGLLLVFGFFYAAWLKVGKDPERSTIIPLYQPADNLSPSEMRYIMRMGSYDAKTTSSAILDMAVKGHVQIEEKDGKYILRKKESEKRIQLGEDEEILFSKIFSIVKEMILSGASYESVGGAAKEHSKMLKEKFNERYFFNNTKYFTGGAVLSLIIIAATFFISDKMNPIALFMYVWLTMWSFGVFALLAVAKALWQGAVKDRKQAGGALFITIFSLPFLAGEAIGIGMLSANSSMLINVAFFSMIALNAMFYKWLKAFSVEGRLVMDRIEGFKMYLASAEKDVISYSMKRPSDTKEYEKYLPYAVALEVEEGWTKAFTNSLSLSNQTTGYKPSWFIGSNAGIHALSSGFHTSFNAAVSQSTISPRRSSSSGFGGGRSGGGGGGGGGGGW